MLASFLFEPQLKITQKLTEFELPNKSTWLLKSEAKKHQVSTFQKKKHVRTSNSMDLTAQLIHKTSAGPSASWGRCRDR